MNLPPNNSLERTPLLRPDIGGDYVSAGVFEPGSSHRTRLAAERLIPMVPQEEPPRDTIQNSSVEV
jgi:hypothetical protein